MMTGQNYRLGLVLVTLAAVAWSLAGFFTRLITLDSWTMLAWRGLFGALGVAAFIAATQRHRGWRAFGGLGPAGWCFAALSAVGMMLFITSLRHTSVAHVAVIYATVPFVAAGFAWLALRERPSASALLASGVALVGVAVMVGLGVEGGLLGDLLAFGMTTSMAGMMVMMRRFPAVPALPAACLSALLCGLATWPFGAPLAVSGQDLVLLALFGTVNSALGLAFFSLGARHLPAIETALVTALDAPLAPLWVWLAFAETPTSATLVGGGIVFAAVAGHILQQQRLRPAVAAR